MKYIVTSFCLCAALVIGCSPQPAELEDFYALGSVDYGTTLSVYCLLDPESPVQNLTVERLSPPSGQPILHYGQPIGVKLIRGEIWRLFTRISEPPLAGDEWDYYVIADSLMDIEYGQTYTMDIETSWGAAARGSTTVPGPFEIVSPVEGGKVDIQTELTVHWTESPKAYGYVMFVFSRLAGETKEYKALTLETSYSLPYGLRDSFIKPYFESFEAGVYTVEVWAIDRNYFDFMLADPDDPFIPASSGLEGSSGIFGSRVMRRVTFTIG